MASDSIVRVQLGPHDVRRYRRRAAERLVRDIPGARILEDGQKEVAVAAKAQEFPPAIKAQLGPLQIKASIAAPAMVITSKVAKPRAPARRATVRKQATAPASQDAGASIEDAGILLVHESRGLHVAPSLARRLARGMPIQTAPDRHPRPLPWGRTLRWDGRAHCRADLVRVGFGLLARGWEAACPLDSTQRLASELSTPDDRATTARAVGDLRVPVYDPRVLFLTRCEAANRLLAEWERQRALGGDFRLVFLRALFVAGVKLLALPPTWIVGKSGV